MRWRETPDGPTSLQAPVLQSSYRFVKMSTELYLYEAAMGIHIAADL